MLRRAGFGATGPQIDAVVNQDWSAYLDEALDLDPDTDPGRWRRRVPCRSALQFPPTVQAMPRSRSSLVRCSIR
jgi:hypothetical protein